MPFKRRSKNSAPSKTRGTRSFENGRLTDEVKAARFLTARGHAECLELAIPRLAKSLADLLFDPCGVASTSGNAKTNTVFG